MIKSATHLSPKNLPKTYQGLVELHVPRPIHDKVDFENVTELIDLLAGSKLNAEQEDYLDLLSTLSEEYEREKLSPLAKLSAHEALKYLMNENNMSGEDLAELLGVDRSTAFKLLKGARNLTTDHLRKLGARFSVSADLFLG